MKMSGDLHAPAAVAPRKKPPVLTRQMMIHYFVIFIHTTEIRRKENNTDNMRRFTKIHVLRVPAQSVWQSSARTQFHVRLKTLRTPIQVKGILYELIYY
jgi:hypothetical protein